MRELFGIDLHDYKEDYNIFSRPSARAIILSGKKTLYLVYSTKENFYKFPGGGINKDEDNITALLREAEEETGLIIKRDSIHEFGKVIRRQKDDRIPETIFQQINYYYTCDVYDKVSEQNLDEYEAEAGFILKNVDIDEAIKTNSEYKSENHFNEIMIERELNVLKIIKNELI